MWFSTKDKGAFHRRVWISWPPEGPSASQAIVCHIILTQGNYSPFVQYCQELVRWQNICRSSEKQHAQNYVSISRYSWLRRRTVWSIRTNNSEERWFKSTWYTRVDCVSNVMAHAQKPDVVFRPNGRVHLNQRGASVQSTTGSRGVRISGSNAGHTMFRGSVKGTGYPLHSPVSPSLPLPCAIMYHHISTGTLPPGSYLPHITVSSRKYNDSMKLNWNFYKG